MPRKTVIGRPKSTWKPEKDVFVAHARESNVTEQALAGVLEVIHTHRNPVIRLSLANAVLHLEKELREARQEAVQEMCSKMGRSYTEIGKLMGVTRQRAWQIGTGK